MGEEDRPGIVTPIAGANPYVLTADEVAAILGQSGSGIRKRAKRLGHVLGVAPLPDTGRRVVFPRIAIERALGLANQPEDHQKDVPERRH